MLGRLGMVCPPPKLRLSCWLLQKDSCWIIRINVSAKWQIFNQLSLHVFLDYIKKKIQERAFHIRRSHHFINRSLCCLQRIHTRLCCRTIVLIVLSHWRDQIEKEWNKGSTATFLEQNLEWVSGVKCPVLVFWDHLN